jgi:hypothetical protein
MIGVYITNKHYPWLKIVHREKYNRYFGNVFYQWFTADPALEWIEALLEMIFDLGSAALFLGIT